MTFEYNTSIHQNYASFNDDFMDNFTPTTKTLGQRVANIALKVFEGFKTVILFMPRAIYWNIIEPMYREKEAAFKGADFGVSCVY